MLYTSKRGNPQLKIWKLGLVVCERLSDVGVDQQFNTSKSVQTDSTDSLAHSETRTGSKISAAQKKQTRYNVTVAAANDG